MLDDGLAALAARRVTTHADGRTPLLHPAPLAGPPHRPHLLTPLHRPSSAIKEPRAPWPPPQHHSPALAPPPNPQRRRRSYSSPPPPAPVAPPLHATLARGEAGDRSPAPPSPFSPGPRPPPEPGAAGLAAAGTPGPPPLFPVEEGGRGWQFCQKPLPLSSIPERNLPPFCLFTKETLSKFLFSNKPFSI